MKGPLSPQLTVVLLGYRTSDTFRLALDHLRSQTASALLELVIVTPSRKELNLASSDLEGFSHYKILELGKFQNEGAAKAAGVKAASAALVAFMEDHSYPEPLWAEALIEAHQKGDFAAVGPIMLNANPRCSASWGAFLVFYSQWMTAKPQGEIKHLPGNQSCYRRDVLLTYGSRLPEMLAAESVLHWDLLDEGHRLYQESRARTYHLNFSNLGPTLSEYFFSSRVFAANRTHGWNVMRRVLYGLGSPLLPLIRLQRMIKDAGPTQLWMSATFGGVIALFLILCVGSLGELFGYAFGAGQARERLLGFSGKRHLLYTSRDIEAVLKLGHTAEEAPDKSSSKSLP